MESTELAKAPTQGETPLRKFGVEEEFLLLDRITGVPVDMADRVEQAMHSRGITAELEFLSCQVETATPVCSGAGEALAALRTFRTVACESSRSDSFMLAGTGLPPDGAQRRGGVTAKDRYQKISSLLRRTGWHYYSTGMHVHIEIPSADAGIKVISAAARWMPALVALSANSPLWQGEDTGFASWRHTQGMAWPVSNYPPFFDSAAHYDRAVEQLVTSRIIPDPGVVNWPVRLSQRFPTVEFRFADSQLRAGDSVALALILRSLTERVLSDEGWEAQPDKTEHAVVTGAMWCAARDGLASTLVDPAKGHEIPAWDFVDLMVSSISKELEHFGDLDTVVSYLARRKKDGGPAATQVRHFESAGIGGLLALYEQELKR